MQLDHRAVGDYLEFAAGRRQPDTVLAAGFDLKTFFVVEDREPVEVVTLDVLAFIGSQRGARDETVALLAKGRSELAVTNDRSPIVVGVVDMRVLGGPW